MLERSRRRLLLLAANDPGTAQELLNKTENGGKALPLWDGDWPRRFFYTGSDLDFQKVQCTKRLIKMGARVSYHARRWYAHVASAFPLSHHYRAVLAWSP